MTYRFLASLASIPFDTSAVVFTHIAGSGPVPGGLEIRRHAARRARIEPDMAADWTSPDVDRMDRLADHAEREQGSKKQRPETAAESATVPSAPTAATAEEWWRELAREMQQQIKQAHAPADFEG